MLKLFVTVSLLWVISSASAQESIVVFAASSLTEAFTEIAEAFEEAHPETEVVLNFAGSSTLATQILRGAPADVFASANLQQVEKVAEEDFADMDSIETFITNSLVLITPNDNPANIQTIEDLGNPNISFLTASENVPIGTYTDLVLHSVNQALDAANWLEQVQENVVSREQNVRRIVAKLALGIADAGIVYQTDVTDTVADELVVISIPPEHNQEVTYVIVPILGHTQSEQTQTFVDFVLSEAGQAILIQWGFCLPAMPEPLTPTPSATNHDTTKTDSCQNE